MPIQILMPALSPTMTEGKLARWLKQEGDTVVSGEALAEIETDKATMEMEAADEGTLGRILVPAGTEGIPVHTPIALLLAEGEDASALDQATPPSQPPSPPAAPARAEPEPEAPRASPAAGGGGRVFATPLARRLAHDARLDLARVRGTGPRGRIVKADVEAAVEAARRATPTAAAEAVTPRPGAAAPAAAATAAPAAAGVSEVVAAAAPFEPAHERVPHTTIRRTIARRMCESMRSAPHFYLTIDCDVDALMALRKDLNHRAEEDAGPNGKPAYRLSVNDFLVRACGLALRKVPAANVSWRDDAMLQYKVAHVSVAVDTPNGLITPVVRDADRKGVAEIAGEVKQLSQKAREGKLRPEDYSGGTFTLSNLGMFGIRKFSAIINPPQACILAVGVVEPRPVVRHGALAVVTMMTCTLSVDHRAVDGATGARFLRAFKTMIEHPTTMLL